jgi:hypothetical protein
MDYKRHIIQSMGNNEVRTILSRMMSQLQGKGAPENTLKEKMSALAIAMDALDFIDGQAWEIE